MRKIIAKLLFGALVAGNSNHPVYPQADRIIFSDGPDQGDSPCLNERMELLVLMDEDTTRAPYMQVEVRPVAVTAAPGDSVALTPLLRFDNGKVAPFTDPFQRFFVELAEGDTLGTLFWDGTTGDRLFNIPGNFGFVADSSAASGAIARIRVTTRVFGGGIIIGEAPGGGPGRQPLTTDPFFPGFFIEGETEIGIGGEDIQISLEIPEPKQLWPTIPAGGVQDYFDMSQVKNSIEEVIVKVADGGLPVESKEVIMSAEWIPQTGGHNHGGSDDLLLPPQEKMGWIVNIEEADSAQGRLITRTNSQGEIRLRYRSPEFGGELKLVAETLTSQGDTLRADDELVVKVPALVPLPESLYYKKVGGTPSHHGPRVDELFQNHRSPDNNHYGTQAFVDSLASLSHAWHIFVTSNSTQDNRQTPLNVNDMSLPNGGKFDIEGEWETELVGFAHDYHRVGRDVDIRTTRSFPMSHPARNAVLLTQRFDADGNPETYPDGSIIYENADFEQLSERKGASPTPAVHGSAANEHYHIYFY